MFLNVSIPRLLNLKAENEKKNEFNFVEYEKRKKKTIAFSWTVTVMPFVYKFKS